jgi:hypothetical protein
MPSACVLLVCRIPSTSMKSLRSRMLLLVSSFSPHTQLWLTRGSLVAERLKREGRLEINEQETMEELEDDEGNVYNRKTYDDLKNQGLI